MSVRHWGQGPEPALLLHCSLAQAGAMAGLARHLGDRLTMTAPDLVGHGTGPDRDPSRDFHDQATEAAAAQLPDAPCHLIGHSLGATLAMRIALEHPGRIRSLTLFEPVLFCASDGPGRTAHDTDFAGLPLAMTRGDHEEAARIFTGMWGAAPFDTQPEAIRTYLTERIWVASATEPTLIHDRPGLLARLPHLATPTLLLEGETCLPVISEINARLAHDIPDARSTTIAGAGHMAPITHPAETASAIAAFLDMLP